MQLCFESSLTRSREGEEMVKYIAVFPEDTEAIAWEVPA